MNRGIKSAALLALLLLGGVASAQTKKVEKSTDQAAKDKIEKKEGVRVHIEMQADGSTRIIDRYFDNPKLADAFVDSVNSAKGDRPQRMRIEINGDGEINRNFNYRFNGPDGIARTAPTPPKPPVAPRAPRLNRDSDRNNPDWQEYERSMEQFDRDMERFGKNMERWGEQFGRDFGQRFQAELPRLQQKIQDAQRQAQNQWQRSQDQIQRSFRDNQERFNFNFDSPGVRVWENSASSSSSTVKSLSVYPNQPFNNRLNLRFTAPSKGDVTILVTDVKGKEVGRETIKDFSGNYVGQIDLSKKAEKGTYFVTVTQGEDGTVKRIVVE
jgi:hypothetical protein